MSHKNVNLLAALSLGLMLLVWFIEFRGIFDFSVGPPRQATGRIASCEGAERDSSLVKWKRKPLILHLDSFLPGIRFSRPASAKNDIITLCERKALVTVAYQLAKPPLSGKEKYWLRGITDNDRKRVIFTQADLDASKKSNRMWAYGVFGFAALSFLYALGLRSGIISGKGKWEYQQEQHQGYERGRFIIRSRQLRGEAIVYLILFSGLTAMLAYFFASGSPRSWWLLLPAALFLTAAYAYLVEVVNVNELTFDNGALRYRQGPLPWIVRRVRIPVENIAEIIAEESTESSSHGPYTLFSVGIRMPDGESVTLFFTNTLEEADAIAELTNRHLNEHFRDRGAEQINNSLP